MYQHTVPSFAFALHQALTQRLTLTRDLATPVAGEISPGRLELATGFGLLAMAGLAGEPAEWPALGQDAAAELGLHHAGVHLRDLHPPDAANGLRSADTYPEHFRDSYLPLIDAALDHGQSVLACDAVAELPLGWVVIHRRGRRAGDYLALATLGSPAEPELRINRPAVQCYALEHIDMTINEHGGPERWIRAMSMASACLLDSARSLKLGLAIGPSAIQQLPRADATLRSAWATKFARAANELRALITTTCDLTPLIDLLQTQSARLDGDLNKPDLLDDLVTLETGKTIFLEKLARDFRTEPK